MQITTMGLVLRATKTGESDRALLILTPEHGLVSAMAKGALRLKNKLFSSTGLFCYSEFVLFEGKSMYIVNEAQNKEVFFGIHEDITSMALCMYLAELTSTLAPTGEDSKYLLRLLLNTFYFAANKKRSAIQLKAIFELRAMCKIGYMPNLIACSDCMCYENSKFCFEINKAQLYCIDCASNKDMNCNLDLPALIAMRHIAYSDDDKLFNFTLADASLKLLCETVEAYTVYCMEKPMRSLEFLHSVLN